MSFSKALARAAMATAGLLAAAPVWAHGPQIQLTADGGQITTRRLLGDGPYGDALTTPTRIYVMPTVSTSNVWVVKPTTGFSSGPGIAPGYGVTDLASLATHPFQAGDYSVAFTGGLLKWDGAAFADAGATQMRAVKNAVTTTTSIDGGPSPLLTFSISGTSWQNDLEEAHSGLAFRFLGDGVSETSGLPDGVYLASLQYSHGALTPSAPAYFIVPKGVSSTVAGEATYAWAASHGIAASQIQALTQIPEPTSAVLAAGAAVAALVLRRRGRGRRTEAS
jgi:hypothetical protein